MLDVETELRHFLEAEAEQYVPRDDVAELVERRSRRRRPVMLGAIAACLVVVVAAVAVVVAERDDSTPTTEATTPSSAVPPNAVRLAGSAGNPSVVITRPGDYVLDGPSRRVALLTPTLTVSPDVCDYLDVSLSNVRTVLDGHEMHARAVLHVDDVRRPVVLGYVASFGGNDERVRNGTVGAPACLANETNEARRAAARVEARRLLALVPVGGDPYSGPLPKAISEPVTRPLTKNLIVEHREWTTPTSPDQVVAQLRAEPPAGLHLGGAGSGSGPQQGTLFFVTLVPTPTPTTAWHAVVVSAVTSGGETIVRVDAEVVWLPARTPGEYAPYRTETVVVNGRRVTDPTKVRALVDAFNGEPTDTGAVRSCPSDNGDRTVIEFVGPEGTHRVVATAGFCGLVTVTVDGHAATPLQDTEQLASLATA